MKFNNQLLALLLFLTFSIDSLANGVLRNGIGSYSMSLGGADLVFSDSPLAAMNANPAALSHWDDGNSNEAQLSLTAALLDGEYNNQISRNNDADSAPGFIPDFAYVYSLNQRTSLGFSLNPISALQADWEFLDPVGTLGVSFGRQTHKASFIVLRSALGIGHKINSRLSIGASAGLLYNRNRLKTPYVFQSHPTLAGTLGGIKVRTNLDADGFGFNSILSVNYKPVDNLDLSLSYTTPSSFDNTGTMRGTAPLGIGEYAYDAKLETSLPQKLSGGFLWQINKPLRFGFQLDWIDWSDAFDDLPLHLSNGSNATLNGIVGVNRIDDTAPLSWRDRFVVRMGGDYAWSSKINLRAGYSYGDSPVPADTVTPMSAAITKHTLTAGLGWQLDNYLIDFAYQWDLPTEINVGNSRLLAGEYNNSSTEVSIHWLSVSISMNDLFN